ncbi:response regulator [Kiloniella laminariae]|uniref:response regulator n=1 Tax=Kiloniella laminariae TaxID=454162 RepID=UPI000381D17F|nr:response regulator [Kiloniella laminariae]
MATILCVEDEDVLREDLVEELTDYGYNVLSARNGAEGFKIVSENKNLDLVLSDISMPVLDGMGLLRKIRESKAPFSSTPFVFLSAMSDNKHMIEGKSLGVDDYIIKPVNFDLLLSTIAKQLAKSQSKAPQTAKPQTEKTTVTPISAGIAAAQNKAAKPGEQQPHLAPRPAPVTKTPAAAPASTVARPQSPSLKAAGTASQTAPVSSPSAIPSSSPQTEGILNTQAPPFPDDARLVAGRFQLLGIDKLKEKVGDKWEHHQRLIHNIMVSVVSKNIGPLDSCRISEDGDMMVCFSQLNEVEARFKLDAIRKEVWIKLLGEEGYKDDLAISAQAFEIKGQAYEVEVEEEEYTKAKDPWDIIQKRIEQSARATQEKVDIFLQEILERAEIRFTRLQNTAGDNLPLSLASFDDFGQERQQKIDQVIDETDPRRLIIEGAYIGQTTGYMISNLIDMAAAGVIMKLDYQLCTNKKEFDRVLILLESLPQKSRERLIIALTGLPNHIHLTKISDLMARLRPFCKMGATELQLHMPGDHHFDMLGVTILILDYHEALAMGRHSKTKYIQAIKTIKLKKKRVMVLNAPKGKEKILNSLDGDFIHIRDTELF